MIELKVINNSACLYVETAPQNAFDIASISNLIDIIDECEMNDKISEIVVTGTGRYFSTGLNMGTLKQSKDEDVIKTLFYSDQLIFKIYTAKKFVIAAINGHAIGGGAALALAADYRIAYKSDKIKIGFPEYAKGLFLPRIMRHILIQNKLSNVNMVLMGEFVCPMRAMELGLVDDVCDGDVTISAISVIERLKVNSANYQQYKQHFKGNVEIKPPFILDDEYKSLCEKIKCLQV